MAYDGARQRILLHGGRVGTWEWDGVTWTKRNPSVAPSYGAPSGARVHAMAYDAARGRVVLFGGWSARPSGPLADTWEWDGTDWVRLSPSKSPSARTGHAMTYDAGRQRVVLFGGDGLGETWEWDGTDWTERFPAVAPAARWNHAMAYDAARQRVLLFGGYVPAPKAASSDTWEWDGTSWTQRSPVQSPPARQSHAIAYDAARQRVVLFGGWSDLQMGPPPPYGSPLSDSWEWDGTNWAQPPLIPGPPARSSHAMAYDAVRQCVVLFGGAGWDDTWEWSESRWTRRLAVPFAGEGYAMADAAARQRIVLFATGDTWEWDGLSWRQAFPPASPSARAWHAMAEDAARQRVVLFGGSELSPLVLNDTWTWDGTLWVQRFPSSAPGARSSHAMVYDSVRQRVVLFGGLDPVARQLFSDTWEWDGASWIARTPATAPSPRAGCAMAYDAMRQRVVLFGGSDSASWLSDTWEWDGTTWTQIVSPAAPAPRAGHAMSYDASAQRIVLFGGLGSSIYPLPDTWERTGTTWRQVLPSVAPSARSGHAMAYDARRGRVVLFGGPQAYSSGETWIYGVIPATAAAVGTGCAAASKAPVLAPFGAPSIGQSSFALDVLFARPSAPAALPLSLGGANVPLPGGCAIYIDPSLIIGALLTQSNASGFASVHLPVPRNQALMGLTVHVQAGVLDPPAPRGVALTNGLALRVGE